MEISQVGVRTRSRAALAMEEEATSSAVQRITKRRKINNRKENRKLSKKSPTVLPEPEPSSGSISDEEFPASCCSSNGSVGITEERIKSLDLEVRKIELNLNLNLKISFRFLKSEIELNSTI
jgi:hypothetical protein